MRHTSTKTTGAARASRAAAALVGAQSYREGARQHGKPVPRFDVDEEIAAFVAGQRIAHGLPIRGEVIA